ncbi:DUF998 domain-containing protein [Rubrobacter marinus]|uniref:DUF998 domain-containing protein n=1 Tax=Rubrobacter marinus TaxID=2653852 RepID=A0A6G8PW63_9ACTN|nr:DUF998 domain-containing protein [Rubrobacter marinus]QIN78452.1 DUF998 domain-containing protein [Rubrobacter marinus]
MDTVKTNRVSLAQRRRGRGTVRRILLGCGVASSVLYVAGDVLGTLRYEGYSYADQWFSELTAQGAPTRPLMVALNVVPYTLLVAAFAVGVWMLAGPRRAARITGVLLLGYAAFGFAGGALFPMRPREALATGEETLRNVMHIPATALMSLCVVLAMGFGPRCSGSGSGTTRTQRLSRSSYSAP